MRYIVYTDGAYNQDKKIAGVSYIIFTEDSFIGFDTLRVPGIDSATLAETVALGLASAHLLDNCNLSSNDEVEIFSDSLSSIKFVNSHLTRSGGVNSRVQTIINSVIIIRRLNKRCKLTISKVRAHKAKMNPNVLVDKLAKIAIRRE